MTQAVEGPLAGAKDALARHAWTEAFELLKQADSAGALSPEGLESLAEAAWWTGHPDDGIEARERAYAAHLKAGNPRRAAYVALQLTQDNMQRRASAVGMAWFNRAQRLLEGERDSPESGYLSLARALLALSSGQPDASIEQAQEAMRLGAHFGDRDLQAYALMCQGMARVSKSEVGEGLALIDEATVAAVSGELGLMATGWIYCNTISTCRELADYRRASEWTDAATRWCERQSIAGFPGICRVHRASIMALRGAWAEAEREARRACDELMAFKIMPVVASGFYEIGEIRLHMGDLAGAEEAFRQAHEMGQAPEPGQSLLRLTEGKPDLAAASIKRALAAEWNRATRARLLPSQVEIAVAVGDLATARAAADELEKIAAVFGTPALGASARYSRGVLQLAEGDVDGATQSLRESYKLWLEVEAPYEVAKARTLLGIAFRAGGDAEAATLELQAAKATFERLGAVRDARRTTELLGSEADARGGEAFAGPVSKTFLFTDIVKSTALVEAIGDEAWQDLIRWHDHTLRSLVAEHRGEEIRHAGDGLVVSFNDPTDAIECALSIQRKLAEHRHAQGFAPPVRIGMHTAEASRRGLDYAGKGIHEAARIAALADAGEVLASAKTLSLAPTRFRTSEPRVVSLKGVAEPIEVVTIDWR